MKWKHCLFLILLLLVILFDIGASETRLMLTAKLLAEMMDFGAIPGLELTISTSPLLKGFQQEFGLRGTSLLVIGWVDLILRSWWSFPRASSSSIRERFRLGIEYSPMLFAYIAWYTIDVVWLPGITAAVCASINLSEWPTARRANEIYLAAGATTMWDEPTIHLQLGFAWRRKPI